MALKPVTPNVSQLVPLSTAAVANPSEVGGKAASLIRLLAAGFPVPPGCVLTTAFFASWSEELGLSQAWAGVVGADPAEREARCVEMKRLAGTLPLNASQRATLADLREYLAQHAAAGFAVRSSSPEEDLATASWAGMYTTHLGVGLEDLEDAVRSCFASSFDARVVAYRQDRGVSETVPTFAVIVQQQVDSDSAGVGFSLNPVTNDYDEAVFEASWGLGVSVVDGRVTPDHVVMDRVRREVISEVRGDRQLSTRLRAGGGTVEVPDHRAEERVLTDRQLAELCDVIDRIEALYDMPIDIEWAYQGGTLYILQARPITRYVPLPAEMMTPRGERRRLYGDAALSKGLTSNAPISTLGLDNMERMFLTTLERWVGPMEPGAAPEASLFFFAGSRMYVNYSNMLWLVSPASLARSSAPSDELMAATLAGVDACRYRAETRPPWLNLRLLWVGARTLRRFRGLIWNVLRAVVAPERMKKLYDTRVAALQRELREPVPDDVPLEDLQRRLSVRLTREFDVLLAALVVGIASPGMVLRRRNADVQSLARKLERGVQGNAVVEMGVLLHRLAVMLDRTAFDHIDRLADSIRQRSVLASFLSEWDRFVDRYGARGPAEMDLASPRYGDDPLLALRQMSFMAVDGGFDPQAANQRHVEERQAAGAELMTQCGPLRRMLLRRMLRINELFAGTRDTPKQLIVQANYILRQRALAIGRRLTDEGRLDAPDHVFDLRFADLRAAIEDSAVDLRSLREERSRFRRRLETHVTTFPAVIDSRGRILRPPASEEGTDVLRGTPVSAGVATGPVKVLHTPSEKAIQKGDVLVAYTTDPGWTPLFMNAAAIILEVGGVLQHGAVVAREYGKPCVVGIDNALTRLRDGQVVEVDGAAGTIRMLPHVAAK
jgi:rifampicin phosphotransferase